jgi:hypothetical protein
MKNLSVKNPAKLVGIANRMLVAGPKMRKALTEELLAAIFDEQDGEHAEDWKRPATGAVKGLLSAIGNDREAGIVSLRNVLSHPSVQNNGSAVSAIAKTLRILREQK